jgi:cation:H+ antiporter
MTHLAVALRTPWQRRILEACSCALAGMAAAVAGGRLPAIIAAAMLGAGVLGASLLLAWAADAAEVDLSGRLVIMVVVIIGVLPELTVEVHLAYTRQVQLVAANLTGATRLLTTAAIALPALGAVLARSRGQTVTPPTPSPARRLDLMVLGLAALWALTIAERGRLTLVEAVILGVLYIVYVMRGRGTEDDPPATLGVAAQIAALDPAVRKRLCRILLVGAALAVLISATAFPGELLSAGRSTGFNSYVLFQSVIPLFTEAPELVVATTLVLNGRPAQGISLLLASSITQSTLVVGSTSVAYLVGGGGTVLPLTGRERVEMLLTAATTLMSVAALASLRLERIDGWIMTAAFGLETLFPALPVRLVVAIALLMFATDILLSRRRHLLPIVSALPQSLRRPRRDTGR